mgnify:CR=1 FL=1
MPKLVELADGIYLLPGRVNIGFIASEGGCYMIDTGLDRDQARRALNALRSAGLRLVAVVNTHSHADHIGGNAFVQRRENVPVLAPREELPFVAHPWLEPALLYGGSYPSKLASKFFVAKPSRPEALEEQELPFEVVSLPGHSPGMVGIKAEGVFFTADAYFGADVLARHVLPYTYDPEAALSSLERVLSEREVDLFVPSHGQPTQDPAGEVEANAKAIEAAREALLKALEASGREAGTCQLVRAVLSELGIRPRSPGLFWLYTSCLRGYLAWLEREGLVEPVLKGAELCWRAIRA